MTDWLTEPQLAALIGLAGGVVLGLAARLGRFCTLGAIEDQLYAADSRRARMWGLAIGCAMALTFLTVAGGGIDLSLTLYHTLPFSPFLAILGGLLFGYGMALTGTCGFGALARLGGGDLRSFVVVLVLGIAALITVSGPLAALRVMVLDATAVDLPPGGPAGWLQRVTGIPAPVTGAGLGLAICAAMLAWPGRRPDLAESLWGLAVGLAVFSGWLGTSLLASHGFDQLPVISHTFSAPPGDSILYLMTASGGGLGFGVGSVFGVVVGAFMGSLAKGHFRWEACEDPRELRRQIAGAGMMGVGAVLAAGCTIGQGVSAMAVLAYSAPLVLTSIWIGAAFGLHRLIAGPSLAE